MLPFLIYLSLHNLVSLQDKKEQPVPVKVEWVKSIRGNFSFINSWQYPEGIFRNHLGQLVCDGLCPEGTEKMLTDDGSVKKEFLNTYYKYVDTSHLKHSIQSEAWCYEWAGTDFIDVFKKTSDTIVCKTKMNAATHCSLRIAIIQNKAYATIELKSVAKGGEIVYTCKSGIMRIEKEIFKKGILKADFDFTFDNPEDQKRTIFWRGKIFAQMKS